jgi:hypothetical protein
MPRAALLSIHARVEGTEPSTWEDPSLVQFWGPRYNSYVVAARDLAVFSLGRPDDVKGRQLAEDLAVRLHALLGGTRMNYGEAGRALGVHPNALRYAAPTGRVMIRWDGRAAADHLDRPATRSRSERGPTRARTSVPARLRPRRARGVRLVGGDIRAGRRRPFGALRRSLTPVRTPIGDAWILSRDEPALRRTVGPAAAARLLPSGDTYFLFQGADRELLVADPDRRRALWTPRVWPGGLLVGGEVVGTWRRVHGTVTVQTWRRLSRPVRDAVEAEAQSLPLPGISEILVRWDD